MFEVRENTFGDRLKELRESRQLSQKTVAPLLGITNFQLSKYETGRTQPDLQLIAEFAQYYCVTSDYLLGLSSVKHPFLCVLNQVSNEDIDELERYFRSMVRKRKTVLQQ